MELGGKIGKIFPPKKVVGKGGKMQFWWENGSFTRGLDPKFCNIFPVGKQKTLVHTHGKHAKYIYRVRVFEYRSIFWGSYRIGLFEVVC